jgi:uncharacterized membrane protein YkvA (DUF1232 family)
MKQFFQKLKSRAKELKRDVFALYLAYLRPDVPWYAKFVAILVVAYALSPVDLIPDFIPVLGYLDDVILIPLGVMWAVRLIPVHIMEECRKQAAENFKEGKPRNWVAGAVIITLWVLIVAFVVYQIVLIANRR